jgi:hypothetical protein
MKDCPPWKSAEIIRHARLLDDSYRHWTGRGLLGERCESEALSRALYQAPMALLSHGTQADPLFNYANARAQELWGLAWGQFVGMPSRHSAETQERVDRSTALSSALSEGYLSGYSGIRIAANGRRFRIYDGEIWNLLDGEGGLQGQAAAFSRWDFL